MNPLYEGSAAFSRMPSERTPTETRGRQTEVILTARGNVETMIRATIVPARRKLVKGKIDSLQELLFSALNCSRMLGQVRWIRD